MQQKGCFWLLLLASEWYPFTSLPMGVQSFILPQNNVRHKLANTQHIIKPTEIEKRHVAIVKDSKKKADTVRQSSTQWFFRKLAVFSFCLSLTAWAALNVVEDTSFMKPPAASAVEIVQDSGTQTSKFNKKNPVVILQPNMRRPSFGSERLVMDLPNVIASNYREDIANEIQTIQARTGSEVCVVITDEVAPGYTPKRMATTLFNNWKLSSTTSSKNNGVLFLVVLNDHRTEVEVGRGLNNFLGKSWCQSMLRRTSSPLFKQEQQYGKGVLSSVRAIGHRLQEVDGSMVSSTANPWKNIYDATFVGAGVTFSLYVLFTQKYPLDASCPSCGASGRTNWSCPGIWTVTKEPTNLKSGSKTKTCYCRVCQTQKSIVRTIRKYDGVDSNGRYYYGSDTSGYGDSDSSWSSDSAGGSDGGGGGDSW